MAFTAADYQGMSQQRRRRKNPGVEMAPEAMQARAQSSRQRPAGTGQVRIDRARPGVPAMPVQGLQNLDTSGSAQEDENGDAPESGGAGSSGLDPSSGQGVGEADAGTGGVGSGMQQFPAGMFPGQQAVLKMLPGGVDPSVRLGGVAGFGGSQTAAPDSNVPSLAEEAEEEAPLGDYISPIGSDQAFTADAEGYRNPDNIGRVPGRAPGYGSTLPGETPEQSAEDALQEEFDELLAGLEAEREKTAASVNRDLAASQRRQAEINAQAGRSIGGGFGGAVATTAVMGAAALEEADRAIREKITNAQASWLDKKMQALEMEKQREGSKDLLRAQQTHDLKMEAIGLGSVDGGVGSGSPYGPTVQGAGGTSGGTGAGGGSQGAPGGQADQTQREYWEDGWRREAGSGRWKNTEGEYWDEINAGQPNPFDGSEHFQNYESTAAQIDGTTGEWPWGLNDPDAEGAEDHVQHAINSENYLEEHTEGYTATGRGGHLAEWQRKHNRKRQVYEDYPVLREEEYQGKSLWDVFWDGKLTYHQLISATVRLNETEFDKSDFKGEDFHEEAMDNIYSDETVFTGPGGETIHGEELMEMITDEPYGLGHLLGFDGQRFDTIEGDPFQHGYYSNSSAGGIDNMLMYVTAQPGMLKEIVNWSLNERNQGQGTEYLGGENSMQRLKEHLEQAGFVRPGYEGG